VAIATAVLLAESPASAAPRLPAIVSDGMVVQRDRPVAIWGWAEPGEAIMVRVADARADTVTGSDGRWRVRLPPLAAGGPFTLMVRGTTTVTVKDVLVGDVWLCAGQSNMTFPLGATDTAAADVAAASHPELRLFTVARASSLTASADTHGRWQASTPETARAFSAVAYYFGVELQRHLDVPIGVVQASWSGSAGEEWLDDAALDADPILRPIADRWRVVSEAEREIYRTPERIELTFDDVTLVAPDGTTVAVADFDDGRQRTHFGGTWAFDWTTAPDARFELARLFGEAGWAAAVTGTRGIADLVLLRMAFRPWAAPFDATGFRALRFRVRGRTPFRVRVLQSSITDFDDYASAPIHPAAEWRIVTIPFDELAQAGWGRRHALSREAVSGIGMEVLPAVETPRRPPAGIFHGMILPIAPYAIRGVLWYQGESNNGRAYQYRRLLPALIRSWRAAWQDDALPFAIVQLPAYGKTRMEPRGSRWAELRDAQLSALALPYTGLVVTLDQGDPDDVHPKRKVEVARRAARWAQAVVYDHDVVPMGPRYDSSYIDGGRMRVHFRPSVAALATRDGGTPRGFAVAGADRVFAWADARIDGDTVVVWSDAVPHPVAVRYAWADSPDATLIDDTGLPASPFRSDRWPGKTDDER